MTAETATGKVATGRKISLERRAEIGAERRAKSRTGILIAAFRLFGAEGGSSTRIEDICAAAGVARGTFYNHFQDLDALKVELAEELTREFDKAVHIAFEKLGSPMAQAATAMRYYLHAARLNPAWGWAMVNSGLKPQIFGRTIWLNSLQTIQAGIDAGQFRLRNAHMGRDILIGITFTAMISCIRGEEAPDYAEEITRHLLITFGIDDAVASAEVKKPLLPLPQDAREGLTIVDIHLVI